MKKKFVAVLLCMALLSSFTVSASAEFDNTDSSNLATLTKYCSSLWQGANFSNKSYNNWCYMLGDALTYIYDVNSGLVQRVIEIQSKIDASNQHLGNISSLLGTIDSHIGSGFSLNHEDLSLFSSQNHSDLTSFMQFWSDTLTTQWSGPESEYSTAYRFFFTNLGTNEVQKWFSLGGYLDRICQNFWSDVGWFSSPTLYKLVHQLQQVLASDDDLQLKKDNKANEDAATDAFVNGSSSKTSLGTGDIGNLKDVGGTFNDLTSLNGQSSVSSFLSGLTSADGTGQGWFSEATRASLDAVSAPVTTTRLVQKHWRGEKSLTYSISADTSLNVVVSPAPARALAADSDPYNMSGFEDNYNWLWGDAS